MIPDSPAVSPVPPTRENFCDDCGRFCAEKYLSAEHKCQRCQRIDEPCEFMPEPRGAFGIAQGWCRTHDVGWIWCEHAKIVSAPPVAPTPEDWKCHACFTTNADCAAILDTTDEGPCCDLCDHQPASPAPSVGELEWRERFMAFDVGCIDCDESSSILGLFATEAEAQAKCDEWDAKGWRGGEHYYEVFDLQRILSGAAEEGR